MQVFSAISAKEIIKPKKTPSNSTEKDNLLSSNESTITSVKTGNEVRRVAIYLSELLKPDHDMLGIFMKYAWRYDEPVLVGLAIKAKERDKQGNPAKFFNFLVKDELGYKKV